MTIVLGTTIRPRFFFFVLITRVKSTLALIDVHARVFLRIAYARLQSESAEIQSGGVLSVHGPVSMFFARLPCCRCRRNRRHPCTRSAEGRDRDVGTQDLHKSDFDRGINKMESRTSFVDIVRGPPPLTRVDYLFVLFGRSDRKTKNICPTINILITLTPIFLEIFIRFFIAFRNNPCVKTMEFSICLGRGSSRQ